MTANHIGDIDLLDGNFYVDDPYSKYAKLREHAPLVWDSTNELWGVSRYDHIVEIEKRNDIFINSDQSKGGYRPNIPADAAIIGLDDPLHNRRRMLVARRFTPRAVGEWADHVRDVCVYLIETARAKGQVDVVEDLAGPLPAMMIGLLLGFPDDMWPKLKHWSETTIVLGGGPRYFADDGIVAAMEFAGACAELYEEKQKCPADDVMSVWAAAKIPGHEFGLPEVISDCLLLLDGGAETTRTVIARSLLALHEYPEELAKLRAGADINIAIEEFIRWVTPIHNMCRVATDDYEIGGVTVKAGQQVLLMYSSANRDEAHFEEPERFDVTRNPNNHIAFGFGTHFCLGASLARLEIRTFFEEFLARVPDYSVVPNSAVEMPSPFVYGLKSAEVVLS